jgi:hypothetical protein
MDKTEEQTGSAGIGGSESNSETQKLSTRDHLMQAVKFTLLSISAGGVEAASFGLLDMLTPWSPR